MPRYWVVYESSDVLDPRRILEDIADAMPDSVLGIVTAGVLNSYPITEQEFARLKEENKDYETIFDAVHSREVELIQRWRGEGRLPDLTWPDYGKMLEWLMEERELAVKSNAEGTGAYWFNEAKKLADKANTWEERYSVLYNFISSLAASMKINTPETTDLDWQDEWSREWLKQEAIKVAGKGL